MEQIDVQQDIQSSQGSPAELLSTTRESLGMSREEVAAALRLHVRLITALEENDRTQLPPAAFIGGYLRAYAKLLGLAPEPLINSYLDEGVSPSDFRSAAHGGESMASSQDPKYRLITIGVVVGLLGLFVIWWANERYAFVTAMQTGSEQQVAALQPDNSVAMPLEGEVMALPPGVEGIPQLAMEPTAEPSVVETALPLAPHMPAAAPMSGTPAALPSQAKPVPAPVLTVAPPAVNPTAAPPAPLAPVSPLSAPLSSTVPQARLRLEYQAQCWTQVTDAQGRTLAYQLMGPGKSLELRGVAPFKVFLGYAPGVLVYYNGAFFSHSSYQSGDIAKFSLGQTEDNRPLAR